MIPGDKYWAQFVFVAIVLAITFMVSLVLRFFLGRFIRAASRKLKVDPTRYNFFKNAVDFILFFIATIVIFRSIPSLHTYGTGLLTGAGVLAAIVGFASQSAFSNIVSGIFLVIFKPFSVGDRVRVGQNYTGDVEDITLRHTVIKDFENRRVIIPNAVISTETIINSTIVDERICVYLEIAVDQATNLNQAIQIIQEEAMAHRYFIDNRSSVDVARGETPVMVRVLTFLNGGILLRAYVWTNNPSDAFDLKCDLNKSVKERFDQTGIRLSDMQYQVVNKSL
ncbi:MAG: Protein involved in stability of MscS mechanosensitive channel [Cytophagales bacterium]|jgi:small-conductance mechanosensitive channel|nr:mechanosensitive ion channel family protein [Bacteroidota bacterium]MBS1981030.1 mechanosensitive ion channel family protein [Bacteroidota bacterium]WHZ08390.1 MAG: Protein involved in stability of MscS mechanosensitive channel [Cytophagales bacterium]